MANFIDEFYYGSIEPQSRSTKQNKTVQKQMKILTTNEKLLAEALSNENKKLFLDYVNAWGIVNGESNLDSFIMVFHLGAKFKFKTFVSSEMPFEDFYRSDGNKKKYYIALDECERGIIINSLNEMRNHLIISGKYTNAVDEVLFKVIDTKQKKLKVIYREA